MEQVGCSLAEGGARHPWVLLRRWACGGELGVPMVSGGLREKAEAAVSGSPHPSLGGWQPRPPQLRSQQVGISSGNRKPTGQAAAHSEPRSDRFLNPGGPRARFMEAPALGGTGRCPVPCRWPRGAQGAGCQVPLISKRIGEKTLGRPLLPRTSRARSRRPPAPLAVPLPEDTWAGQGSLGEHVAQGRSKQPSGSLRRLPLHRSSCGSRRGHPLGQPQEPLCHRPRSPGSNPFPLGMNR